MTCEMAIDLKYVHFSLLFLSHMLCRTLAVPLHCRDDLLLLVSYLELYIITDVRS